MTNFTKRNSTPPTANQKLGSIAVALKPFHKDPLSDDLTKEELIAIISKIDAIIYEKNATEISPEGR